MHRLRPQRRWFLATVALVAARKGDPSSPRLPGRQSPQCKPSRRVSVAVPETEAATPASKRPARSLTRPEPTWGGGSRHVMSWQGAEWLFRETRVEEEQPEAMLDALKIPRGATVADVGAGAGYHSIRLARRVGPDGNCSGNRPPARDARDAQEPTPERPASPTSNRSCATQLTPSFPTPRSTSILMVDVYHECSDPETTLNGLFAGPQTARAAGAGRISRRRPRGTDHARTQDDPQTGPPRSRAPRFPLQRVARIPALAARHHLRETRTG